MEVEEGVEEGEKWKREREREGKSKGRRIDR